MLSNTLRMSRIDITFTNETTRSTFRSVIREIRGVLGVRVTSFINHDALAFHVWFEGLLNPDLATSQYSRRLSQQARRYIASMEIRDITSPGSRVATERKSNMRINAVKGTTRSTFDDVVREITKKLGVKVTCSYLGGFRDSCAMFEGPISADEVFMQYSRKLSKKALRSITLSVENTGQPVMPISDAFWQSVVTTPTNVASQLPQGPFDFGLSNPSKLLDFFREMIERDSFRGFRFDAPVPLLDGHFSFTSNHEFFQPQRDEQRPRRSDYYIWSDTPMDSIYYLRPDGSMGTVRFDEPTDDKQ